MEWLGFWLFMCVFWYVEYKMYTAGHDTFFFEHKTEAEKQIRKNKISSTSNQGDNK